MTTWKACAAATAIFAFVLSAFAADINGRWTPEFDTQVGSQKYTYELRADAARLTGTASKIAGDGLRPTRKAGEFATEELVAKRVK